MRCADLGPTPGRQRSASISSSRAVGDFISFGQNGSFIPGGRPRPPVSADIFSWTAASTLRTASLIAAATRSSSMSLSSASRDESMWTRLTSCLQVIVTLTMPAPDCPSTSTEASSSWSLRMFSCICWACFIKPAICAFIEMSPSLCRLDRGLDDGRVEILDQVTNERIPGDCCGGSIARAVAGGFPYRHGQAHGLAEAFLQGPAKLLLEAPFREVFRGRGQIKLERLAVEAPELACLGKLLGDAAEIERIGELGPIAVERPPRSRLAIPRRRCRPRGLASCRAAALRFARAWCALRESDAMQKRTEIGKRGVEPDAAGSHVLGDRQHGGRVAAREPFEDSVQEAVVDRAEHGAHGLIRDVSGAVRDRLIEERQGVAHAPARALRQEPQRPGFGGNLLLSEYGLQVSRDRRRRHLLQVELQAAREHR